MFSVGHEGEASFEAPNPMDFCRKPAIQALPNVRIPCILAARWLAPDLQVVFKRHHRKK